MAEFLDGNQEPQLADNEEYETLEESLSPAPETDSDKDEEEQIPAKYQGKSAAELIQMHQEAEKLAGRQGNEVGELRKLVDDFITHKSAPKETEEEVVSDIDFLENPNEALNKKLESHPALKAAREANKKLDRLESRDAIFAAHPDAMDIVHNEQFQEWVGKSQARTKKLQRADADFDFEAADDLFTSWKEQQELVAQAKAASEGERKRSLKSGSNGTARGSGEAATKKFLKRSEILHMMQHEPERYLANNDVIMKAYAEGRVR